MSDSIFSTENTVPEDPAFELQPSAQDLLKKGSLSEKQGALEDLHAQRLIDTATFNQAYGRLTKPDENAQLLRDSIRTGLTPDFIREMPEAAEPRQSLLALSPAMIDYLSTDKVIAGISKNDYDKLSLVEKSLTRAVHAAASAAGLVDDFQHGRVGINELGKLYFNKAMGVSDDADEARIAEIEAKFADYREKDGLLFAAQSAAELLGQQAGTIADEQNALTVYSSGLAGSAAAIAAGNAPLITLGAPEEVVTAPTGFLTGAGVGFAAVSVKDAFLIETGHAFKELSDITDEEGNHLDPQLVQAASLGVGAINAGLEVAAVKGLAKVLQITPGGEALSRKFVSNGVKKALQNKSVRDQLLKVMGRYATGITQETATEVAQEIVPIIARNLLVTAEGGTFDTVGIDETMDRVIAIAKKTSVGFGLLGGPAAIIRASTVANKALDAQAEYERLLETKRLLDDTETYGLSKEAAQVFPQIVKANVYEIDAEAAVEINRENPEIFAKIGLTTEAINQAAAGGATLQVQGATLLANLEGGEVGSEYQRIAEITRISPESMTQKEAEAIDLERDMGVAVEELDAALKETVAFQESLDSLKSRFRDAYSKARPDLSAERVDAEIEAVGQIWEAYAVRNFERGGNAVNLLDRIKANVVTRAEAASETPGTVQFEQTEASEQDALIQEARGHETVDTFVEDNIDVLLEGAVAHRPTFTGATADNVEASDQGMPDFYENPGLYRTGDKTSDAESVEALLMLKGDPEAEVTIYRAAPKDELRIGDWVTLSENYAEGEALKDETEVHSFKVKAKDIHFAGDSINEFGYYPETRVQELIDIWNQAQAEQEATGLSAADQGFQSFDEEYPTLQSLMDGVEQGDLLIHARRAEGDASELRFGLDPEFGETLRGTEAAMTAEEFGIEPAPLVFMSDSTKWVGGGRDLVVFVRKDDQMQQSLGEGRVKLSDGTVVNYELSPVADFESEALRDEPFGVETGDWYAKHTVDVAGVAPASLVRPSDAPTSRQEFDQPSPRGIKRGRITAIDDEFLVSLFEGAANASTLIHETGHLFLLELQSSVEAGLANDEAIRDWGITQQWLEVDAEEGITVEQNEQFAEGFEAYIMEGKAPSPELANAFERFRRWLMEIYQRVKQLSRPLTPEIRGVFDRMLASDQQIEQAATEYELLDENNSEPLNLSAEEKAFLKNLNRGVRAQAKQQLHLDRAENRKQLEKQWRANAERALAKDPVWQLRQKMLDEGGMDLDQVTAEFGPDVAAEVRKKNIRFIKRDGQDIRDLSDEFGFDALDVMMDELLATDTKEEAIQSLVDIEAAAYEAAESNADEAISNVDALQDQLEAAARYIARAAGAPEPKTTQALLKRFVKNQLSNTIMRAASRPDRYMANVKRNLQDERAAVARGDFIAALEANRQARVNLEFANQSRAIRDDLRAIRKTAKRLGRMKKGTMDEQHAVNLQVLLQRFDLLKPTDKMIRDLATFLSQNKKTPLIELVDVPADPLLNTPPSWSEFLLDENFVQKHQALTVAQFTELSNLAKFLDGNGRDLLHQYVDSAKMSVDDMALLTSEPAVTLPDKPLLTADSPFRKTRKFFREYFSQADNLHGIFQYMDGFTNILPKRGDLGPNEQFFWRELSKASSKRADRMRTLADMTAPARQQLLASATKLPSTLTASQVGVPVPAILSENGIGWTFEHIVAIALNMGNVHNRQAVAEGYGLTDDDLLTITGPHIFSDADWDAVQQILDAVNSLAPDTGNVFKKLNYFTMEFVEPDPFITQSGKEMKGGYYPAAYDSSLSDKAGQRTERQDLLTTHQGVMQTPATKKGHVQKRVGSGGLPIKLSLTTLSEHLDASVQYIYYAQLIRDIDRVTMHPTYSSVAKRKMGTELYRMIRPALQNIARGDHQPISSLDKFFERHRALSTLYILGFKTSVALKQPFSVLGFVNDYGWGALWDGITETYPHPIRAWRAQTEMSPYMYERTRTAGDREIEAMTRKGFKLEKTVYDFIPGVTEEGVKTAAFIQIKAMDLITVMPIWQGAYNQALANNGGDTVDAVVTADEAVARSQPSTRPMDQSYFQYTKGMHRLFTMFSTFTMKFGQRQRGFYRAQNVNAMSRSEYFKTFMLESLLPPMLMHLLFQTMWGNLHRDEPEEIAEGLFFDTLLYQFAGLPYFRDLARLSVEVAKGDARAGKISPPAFVGLEKGAAAAGYGILWARDLDNDSTRDKAIRNFADTMSYSTGIPASRIYRDVKEGMRQWEEEEGGNPLNVLVPDPEKR
jgi:hypothetical protein